MITRGCAPIPPVLTKVCLLQILLITFVWPDAGSAIPSFISTDLSVLARSWLTFPERCLADAAKKRPCGTGQAGLGLASDRVVLSPGLLAPACKRGSAAWVQLPVYATGLFLVTNQSGERLRLVPSQSALERGCWWPCVGGELGSGAGGVKK